MSAPSSTGSSLNYSIFCFLKLKKMELMTEDSLRRIVISMIMCVKCTEGMHSKITITQSHM